jgi:class 3 adenylate cyclase/tRNA A-37 threonylcarbamoyl transferase component Bud32
VQCGRCRHDNREGARFCDDCGAQLATEEGLPDLPTTLGGGRYRVERLLGEGARKRVYLAHDERLGREVAVARIKTEGLDDAGRHRIDREARATARLGDHPNIVTVFDVVDEGGEPQIVSQYMPGGTLAELLAAQPSGRLSVEGAMRVGEELALALAHAHALGVVHRDVKPANVWLGSDGTAQLGDFGLAVTVDESRLTAEGMVVGTVAYLAPEQATGRAPDTRSDLYSLGALLYEVLTGTPPFVGDDAVAVISQHLNTSPVATTWHNADVPRGLDGLVVRLLAKNPADRPASADEVVAELRRIREHSMEPAMAPASRAPDAPLGAADWRSFVGRSEELAALRGACDDAMAARSRLVLVVGEPGVGKTRLVEEATAYAAMRGAQVCWGHSYEGDVGVAYLPFVEALRGYVRSRVDDDLRAELGAVGPEIATLVPELRTRFPELPESPPLEADAERMRLFDGVATFLQQASRAHPIVVVLDDLHWADKPTLLLLQYLARNLRHDRILVLGTYRDVDLDRQHPLADALGVLRREQLYERVLLRGLSRDGVKALIEAVGGQQTPDVFADTIHRETEGNPFFVAEILRHLVETGAIRRVDGRWIGTAEGVAENLPEGVREVIGRRLSHLSSDANGMLTVAAAMPGGFTLPVVGAVTGYEEDRVLDLLDEALERQVVRERARVPGTYEFTHALIRQTLYGELSTPRRVRLHRQIGEALESTGTGRFDSQLPELAYHWFQAAPGGAVDRAVDYAVRAGDRALEAAAHEEAARFYDQALQALDLEDEPDDVRSSELLLAKGAALHLAGATEEADAALAAAASGARRLGEPDLLGRIALAATSTRWVGSADAQRVALLEEALAVVGADDPALRSRLLAALSSSLVFSDPERQIRLSDEAIALARASGDPPTLARALGTYSWRIREERSDEYDVLNDEILALTEGSGDLEEAIQVRWSMVLRAVVMGDRAALDRHADEYHELSARTRSPSRLAAVAQHDAAIAVIDGRYDDAEGCGREMLDYGRRLRDPNMINNFGILMFPAWREQGRVEVLEAPTRRAVEQNPSVPAWRAGLAEVLLALAKPEEAHAELDVLARDDFVFPDDPGRRYGLCGAAHVAAELGDAERCRVLYDRLHPEAGLGVILGPTAYHGATDRFLGLLALALERSEQAIEHLERALVTHDAFGARPWAARTRYDLARALLARGREGDQSRAFDLLNRALDAAHEIGMPVLVDEILPVKLDLQGIGSGSSSDASIDAVTAAVSLERPDLRRHAAVDGRLTLCFSDIAGYTAMTDRLGDVRSQQVLRAHNEILRSALAANGGVEVKSQGDGFMLAFTAPGAAVAFACGLRRGIEDHDFGHDVGDLRLRVGIHTGTVLREGDDFFGRTVIVAARVADAATPGEVLVTDEVHSVLPASVEVGAARDVELKGFPGTHRVHPVLD